MSLSCNSCKKAPPEISLKHCAKCSTTLYCSRDCQKADWKSHKKVCGRQDRRFAETNPFATGTGPSPPKGLEQPITKPFASLDNGTWLHHRPEADVYRLLIDAYRLRMEDNYNIEGHADEDSLYGGATDGLRGFRRFLQLTESRRGLFPSWWDAVKQQMCESLGMDVSQWHNLRCTVKKSDIIEYYGDPQFPMQLRLFAEAVYLKGVGGADGTQMRKMMVAMEHGGLETGVETHAAMVDTTTMNVSELKP